MSHCASRLALLLEAPTDGTLRALIEHGHFCQARLCPFCEWRRARAWRARLLGGLGAFVADHPTHRPLFATFTVRNCPPDQLRSTIEDMHRGFHRMKQCAFWPTAFWFRRTEITVNDGGSEESKKPQSALTKEPAGDQNRREVQSIRNPEGRALPPMVRPITLHPHIHCLLMVPASYYSRDYVRTTEWTAQWQMANRLDYTPVVDIRNARSKDSTDVNEQKYLGPVLEAAKYIAKSVDIEKLGKLAPLVHLQLKGARMVACSRKLRKYVNASDITADEMTDSREGIAPTSTVGRLLVQWDELTSKYRLAP